MKKKSISPQNSFEYLPPSLIPEFFIFCYFLAAMSQNYFLTNIYVSSSHSHSVLLLICALLLVLIFYSWKIKSIEDTNNTPTLYGLGKQKREKKFTVGHIFGTPTLVVSLDISFHFKYSSIWYGAVRDGE